MIFGVAACELPVRFAILLRKSDESPSVKAVFLHESTEFRSTRALPKIFGECTDYRLDVIS